MVRIQHVLATCIGLYSLSLAGDAAAAPNVKGANGKRFRLHIDTNVFDFVHFDADGGPMGGDDESNSIGFGPGRPTLIDGSAGLIGLFPRPLLGIGFGYVFLGNRAIIGGRLSFSVDGSDIGDDDGRATLVSGQLVPYFHWMFLPGRWVRPYVEGRFGFGGGSTTLHEDLDMDGEQDDQTTRHLIFPTFGVGGGVHLFPVEYFSVDLGLDLDYVAPHTRQTSSVDGFEDTEWDKVGDAVGLAIRAGLSVWF